MTSTLEIYEELAPYLRDPKHAKDGRIISFCPVHPDGRKSGRRSLSLHPQYGLTCFAGCDFKDIVQALKVSAMSPLNGSRRASAGEIEAPDAALVMIYKYQDAEGNVIAEKGRFEYPDGSKSFKWRLPGAKDWPGLNGLKMESLPLYNSNMLEQVNGEADIYYVEGEKAADACVERGLIAVSFAGGASSRKFGDVLEILRGCDVVLWPDNDQPGRNYMEAVAAALEGIARRVKVVKMPAEMPEKGDAYDYFHKLGGTVEALEYSPRQNGLALTWQAPVPFAEKEGPEFPIEFLPDAVRHYVEAQADSQQVPIDLPACLVLGIGAAAGAGRVEALIRDGWHEPANLFIMPVLPSGERKSSTMRDIVKPLQEKEEELIRNARPEVAEAEAEREVLEQRLGEAKRRVVKGDGEEGEVASLARELSEFQVPRLPRLIADDATPEAVVSLLADNGGRIAVISTEGSLFETLAGRYSQGIPNLDVFLKGYSGDSIRVDRKGRAPEYIPKPALSLVLTVQPAVIEDLAQSLASEGGAFCLASCTPPY
jgi:putative DNA primase/helicase